MITYKMNHPLRGKVGKVIGMKRLTRTEYDSENDASKLTQMCYQIKYEDGQEALVDIKDVVKDNWHFVTLEELLQVGMPKNN